MPYGIYIRLAGKNSSLYLWTEEAHGGRDMMNREIRHCLYGI